MTPGQFTTLAFTIICLLPPALGAVGFLIALGMANRYPRITKTKHPTYDPPFTEWELTIQDRAQDRAARMAEREEAAHAARG
jgi:hypothetical protein